MDYPNLTIDTKKLRENTQTIINLCKSKNLSLTGVIKGMTAMPEFTRILIEEGCAHIASSRLNQLIKTSELFPNVEKMLIRTPMLSEVKNVIKHVDISMNTERVVLQALDKECELTNKKHKVLLMYDVGDLREGVFCQEELADLALYVENELSNLELFGVGTNLTCYGTVIPTVENANRLVSAVESVEGKIMRPIEFISGGSTTSLPLLINESIPSKINNFRIGAAIMTPLELIVSWDTNIKGLNYDAITIEGEIIEINKKPSVPIGELNVDGFGNKRTFEDKGIRKRAIIAIGNADVGDCTNLYPLDSKIKVLGASSDHMLLDITDTENNYIVGAKLSFLMHYQNVLFAINQPAVYKTFLT